MSISSNISANKSKYFHIIIMLLITFGVGLLPAFGDITPVGMKVLGVFLGLIYGWCAIDLLWPSLLGFFTLSLTGATTLSDAFVSAFSNTTVLTLIVVFAFAEYLNILGVNSAIAHWVMGRKIFVGRPWLLVVGIMLTGVVIGTIGGNFAGLFLLWGVVNVIAEENHIEKGNFFLSMVLAITFYAIVISSAHVPFQAGFLMFSGFFNQATGLTIPNAHFLLIGEIYTIVCVVLIILFAKYILKANSSSFIMTEEMAAEHRAQKITGSQKLALILLVVYFAGLLAPSFMAKGSALRQVLSAWGIIGFSLLYMVIFSILKDEKGKSLADMATAFKNGILWPTLLLMAVTVPLGNAMTSADTGISSTIAKFCLSHFGGMNLILLEILVVIVVGFLTQFMHNIVLGMIFIPILVPMAIQMGGNPYAMFFMLHCAFVCAYATPAGCMQASILFGNKDIPTKHSYLFGWICYVASCIVAIALSPLVNILLPY